MQDAVITLINTPAGRFPWYEEFPILITERLAELGIAHHVGYKGYAPQSRIPAAEHLVVHDETDATSAARLKQIIGPLLTRHRRVLLHSHSYQFGAQRFRSLSAHHRPLTWWATVHRTPGSGQWPGQLLRGAIQLARGRYPDRIFGCSLTATAALQTLYSRRRVGALVNGRLTGEDTSRPARPRRRPRVAILAGRITTAKGVFEAIDAVPLVVAQIPDFRLIVVGDGPQLDSAIARAAELGLGSVIEFAGYQADIHAWLPKADLIWIPSKSGNRNQEGLPLVAMEAQSHHLPAIYSSDGGLPESQVHDQTGTMLPEVSAEAIAAATLALMQDEDRYNRQVAFIDTFRARWAIDRMVDDYVREYRRHFEFATP